MHRWAEKLAGAVTYIDYGLSEFYVVNPSTSQPFIAGENATVAYVEYGVSEGEGMSVDVYLKTVLWPGLTQEALFELRTETWIPPQQGHHYVFGLIPTNATNPLPMGTKVWCEDENEPGWGQLGTFLWGV